jgi:hypothetical protein
MRVWKEQPFGRFTGDLRSVSVAVKVWDRATESYTWDLVQVEEVSPDGLEFCDTENRAFAVADIIKSFR